MNYFFQGIQTSNHTILFFVLAYLLFAAVEPDTFPVRYTAVNVLESNVASSSLLAAAVAPLTLSIPTIGVLAKIQPVGLTDTSEMEPPSNFVDVAWYKNGTIPGNKGSAVIAGHLSGKYVPEAVFYKLDQLKPGDRILITSGDGSTLTFEVTAIKSYQHTDSADEVFFGDPSSSKLNLITCGGSWLPAIALFEERTVVFSELVASH